VFKGYVIVKKTHSEFVKKKTKKNIGKTITPYNQNK